MKVLNSNRVELPKLSARFKMVYKADCGAIDKSNCYWEFFSDEKKLFIVTGEESFEDKLDRHWAFFSSQYYGKAVIKHLRKNGLRETIWLTTGKCKRVKYENNDRK